MFHTNAAHHSSAAEGLRAYGLSGIELGHRAQARETLAARDQRYQQIDSHGLVNNLRQWMGDAMVRAGVGIAGEQAIVPDTAIRANPSMS